MFQNSIRPTAVSERRIPIVLIVTVVLAVFVLTWIAIRKSRSDSYQLLVMQGIAFTEALAQASANAITAETFYDYFVQQRYTNLVTAITEKNLDRVTEQDLLAFVLAHDLFGVYIYDSTLKLILGVTARGSHLAPPVFVEGEVRQLFAQPETNFTLLTDQDEITQGMVHYYLEMTNQLDRVIVLACDASAYGEALEQTGIGYLAQNMAREKGVEYIIYQSTDGIIFASRKPGDLLAIESDLFLGEALESDTIVSRQFEFQGRTVLELVRPFSTKRFPFGLFRVGLSLDGYYSVSRGLVLQLVVLAAILVCLLLVIILYLNSRRKRKELSRQYTSIKSVTDRIFEQMRTGVAVINSLGQVAMANMAFERILGLSGTAGQKWEEIIPDVRLGVAEFMSAGEDADETEVLLKVKGKEKTLLVMRSKLDEEGTNDSSVAFVIYDITRLKEYEQVSIRRERLSEMGKLAAGLAHEIRNPLNTISIAAQRLASEFTPKENSEEYLSFTQKIRNETKRLNGIMTRFLALSHEEEKKRTKVNLEELIGGISELLKAEANQLQVDLMIDVQPGLTMQADPDHLKQIFQNLFNNAKEAISGKPGRISVQARKVDGRLQIVFSDSGPGIPEQLRDKVFTPYFTTKEKGTGLGLPTVYEIVTELGGEVRITESDWGGASIVMTFEPEEAAR